MKLYNENDEMNNANDMNATPVNNTPATESIQNQPQANEPAESPATPTEPMSQEGTAPSQQPQNNDATIHGNTNTQNNGSYAYTRENIPDNTYRAAPQNQNGGYVPYGQNPGYTAPNGQPMHGQQTNNGPTNNGPTNHGQTNNGYDSYTPYGQQPHYGAPQQNGMGQSYGSQPQNQPHYHDGMGYNPVQDGSRISYTPDKDAMKAQKKAKKHGNGKKAAVAVACCCGLLFSTGFGFLGAVIANRVFPSGETEEIVVDTEGNVVSENQKTAVFYKSVDSIATSTAANGGDLTMAQVSALVSDTVVEITTEFVNTSGWFQYVSSGAGSGVILSEDGYIITNNHVICGEDGTTPADTITVRLTSGEEYDAKLVGTDSDSDVAVLKIEAKGLTPAICGDSDKLVVGETVLAVGNPLGELGGTQTDGIISALDREIDVNGTSMTLLQTSAAVNPGNSGGALFNMRGELIGVVNAKSSGTGIEGLGFAIPINDALNVAEQLMEYGYVRGKVAIGVSFYECEDALTARYYGLPGYGVYVMELSKGYNENSLQVLDRVISIDGQEISSFSDISNIVKQHNVGDVLKFQVSRDGKIIEVDVTCYEKVPTEIGEVEFEEN